jgi:hypothetical protein
MSHAADAAVGEFIIALLSNGFMAPRTRDLTRLPLALFSLLVWISWILRSRNDGFCLLCWTEGIAGLFQRTARSQLIENRRDGERRYCLSAHRSDLSRIDPNVSHQLGSVSKPSCLGTKPTTNCPFVLSAGRSPVVPISSSWQITSSCKMPLRSTESSAMYVPP